MIGRCIEKYCSEDISRIENYNEAILDDTQVWDCHHRRESIYTREGLIEIGEYYDRPAIELIFIKRDDHNRIHHVGKCHSETTKERIRQSTLNLPQVVRDRRKLAVSNAHKGKTTWMKGKHHSENTKSLISEKRKTYLKEHPESIELRKSKSLKMAGKVFWNNGTICIRAEERPDETWHRGRLPYKRTINNNEE